MKKRNPIARSVRQIRPSVVPDRRRELIEEVVRREAEEQAQAMSNEPTCLTAPLFKA